MFAFAFVRVLEIVFVFCGLGVVRALYVYTLLFLTSSQCVPERTFD